MCIASSGILSISFVALNFRGFRFQGKIHLFSVFAVLLVIVVKKLLITSALPKSDLYITCHSFKGLGDVP